jgi:Glycosyltransferase family 25 (LPS biosynthesis protein)
MHYHLIHGVDKSRAPRMSNEFIKANIPENNVYWILSHNKDVLTDDFINTVVCQDISITCGKYAYPGCPHLKKGQISCTFKHYLALKNIVDNGYEYAVIMEDNIYFKGDVSERVNKYIEQLNTYYPDWDVIFDSDWAIYKEGDIISDILVYPKTNEINEHCHGGTRCAHFYLLTQKCAKKLYENYIPFNHAPDYWMNDLFRKLDIKSFWAEPSIVGVFPHVSTAD